MTMLTEEMIKQQVEELESSNEKVCKLFRDCTGAAHINLDDRWPSRQSVIEFEVNDHTFILWAKERAMLAGFEFKWCRKGDFDLSSVNDMDDGTAAIIVFKAQAQKAKDLDFLIEKLSQP